MTPISRLILGMVVWAGALWGVLQIANLRTPWDHVACGPWGCGPPAGALFSAHLAWLVVLLPIGYVGSQWFPSGRRSAIGLTIAVVAAAVIAGMVVREATTWLPTAGEFQRPYFIQRCMFVVGISIDVPVVQLMLLGTFWWMATGNAGVELPGGTVARHFGLEPHGHLHREPVAASAAVETRNRP
jgi:hypothetical protein